MKKYPDEHIQANSGVMETAIVLEDSLSKPSSTTVQHEQVIVNHFLSKLFCWIFFWLAMAIGFIWIIDPYGVSPINLTLPGINANKPKRLDIDRLIKPIEVWRYQPKTVLLGTSRIHESIDPTVFNGTPYAPAYNAAIPASTLAENADHIEQYLALDPNIKDIFIELFLYNFTGQQQISHKKTWLGLLKDLASLQLSFDALIDSIKTIHANRHNAPVSAHIAKGGHWVPSEDFNPASTFSDAINIQTVLGWDRASKMKLQQPAFESLDRIVEITRKHGVKLHMLLTPNYPWDDYRLISLGYWPMLEEWLRKVAQYADVVSFSQYNEYTQEEPTFEPKMRWWNDPTHFSLKMGHEMMLTYLGQPSKNTPQNMMRKLTPETVELIIKERHESAIKWAREHSDYVEDFEDAKLNKDIVTGSLDIKHKKIIVDDRPYDIAPGNGEISFISLQGSMLQASGWAADTLSKRHIKQLVATIGNTVVSRGFPTVDREDIAKIFGSGALRSGFAINIPLSSWDKKKPIRVFALSANNRASLLVSKSNYIQGE